MSMWDAAVEEMYCRKSHLEKILVGPCFKIWLSYVTFLLLRFFNAPYFGILDLFILCYKATIKNFLLFVTLTPQCVTEVVYQRAWAQCSRRCLLETWPSSLMEDSDSSRSRILSRSRGPDNLLQKNTIIDLEVFKTPACPFPVRTLLPELSLKKHS